ncbi:calcium-activated chloride channel regulator [Anaeramoeba flamelloides]|uniref:Calcium-activated chloride channel regulator n=1 Tax=Anaeramoeba flamelloides TaxID=1746091 RepID=A0ABQ8YM10_9EUKA|nr:calcium-activated chloride channel regulator [Anaeramoeba flamelloides]
MTEKKQTINEKTEKTERTEKTEKTKKTKETTKDIQIDIISDRTYSLITLNPPPLITTVHADIIAVVDVSGSMEIEATRQDPEGQTESDGLSYLDLVKHACNTIIENCSGRFGLVSYSKEATEELPITLMNEKGKKKAKKAVKGLEPLTCTNIWDGLLTALEMVRKSDCQNAHILLLTDGDPNERPPKGELFELQSYLDEHNLDCSIHTFGFGYYLMTELLVDISKIGNGTFSFIPDPGFVGTCFINTLSNIMVTKTTHAVLKIEKTNNVEFDEKQFFDATNSNWGLTIPISHIHHGQPRHILIKNKFPNEGFKVGSNTTTYLKTYLEYRDSISNEIVNVEAVGNVIVEANDENIKIQSLRNEFEQLINQCLKIDIKEGFDKMVEFQKLLVDNDYLEAISKDVNEVKKALSRKDWFERWGKHYLPSLSSAHRGEYCNNFKDPGVQFYGGKGFKIIQDLIHDTFCNMKPPTHSDYYYDSEEIDMAWYDDSNNACFHGNSPVLMQKNKTKLVKDVKKGDVLQNGARVVCVVKTECSQGKTNLVTIGDLKITPWHPMRKNGLWVFPCEIQTPIYQSCDYVYSFVLDSKHTMEIGGHDCVTFGHGLRSPIVERTFYPSQLSKKSSVSKEMFKSSVLTHNYFGTDKVINDLQKMYGWKHGEILLKSITRSESGLINGLVKF